MFIHSLEATFLFYLGRLTRKAKYRLQKDLEDKFVAKIIDEHNVELRTNSSGLCFKPAAVKIPGK